VPSEMLEKLQDESERRLELAKVVDRHRRDRMHSDMKLGWEMAKEILAEAKELGNDDNQVPVLLAGKDQTT